MSFIHKILILTYLFNGLLRCHDVLRWLCRRLYHRIFYIDVQSIHLDGAALHLFLDLAIS